MPLLPSAVFLLLCPLAWGAVTTVNGRQLKAEGPALASEEEAKLDAVFDLARTEMEGLKPGLKELEALRQAYIEDSDVPALEARRAKLLADVQPRWEKFLRLKQLFAQAKASETRMKFVKAFNGFLRDRSIPADSQRQFLRANGVTAFDQDLRSFHDYGANVLATEDSAHKAARRVYDSRRRTLLVGGGLAAVAVLAGVLLWRRRTARLLFPLLILSGVRAGTASSDTLAPGVPESFAPAMAKVQTEYAELQNLMADLDSFAASYPKLADVRSVSEQRKALRARIERKTADLKEALLSFERMRKDYEIDQGAYWIRVSLDVRKRIPARQRGKAAAGKITDPAGKDATTKLSSVADFRDFTPPINEYTNDVPGRLRKEEEKFYAQLKVQQELERNRWLLWGAGGAAVLLGGAALVLKRLRVPASA